MISIVGAGPAGCMAAVSGAGEDEITLYNEHEIHPVQCAGLISRSGFGRLGIKEGSFIRNKVRGAVFYSPSGRKTEISAQETKAFVVDRREFDAHLLDKAMDLGVKVVNERVKDASALKSDLIILATGINYQLHRKMGLATPKRFITCAQYEMKVDCRSDLVELHFNVPGFFSWIIPVGDYARVGLGVVGNPTPYLNNFIKKLRRDNRIGGSRILGKSYGTIPVYDPGLKTKYEKIVLVGDAAGHVKATTGGGIVMGGLAAKYACLPDYENIWRSEIGRELRLHLMIRRFLNSLSDNSLDRLFSLIHEHRGSIEETGDMDIATETLYPLMKNPAFLAKFLLQSPRFLFDILANY